MTFGFDGEAWHQIESTDFGKLQKQVFLRGVYEALVFGRSQDVGSFPRDVSWDTIIDALDHFYDEPSNRRILVIWALQVVNLKLNGRPEAQIQSAVRRNRCRGTVMREGRATDPVDFERRVERCLAPR